jgi:Type IV secretion system pilin
MATQLTTFVNNVLQVTNGVGVTVATILIIWGTFQFMIASQGSTHQAERGKTAIIAAIVGLMIIVGINALVSVIKSIVPTA